MKWKSLYDCPKSVLKTGGHQWCGVGLADSSPIQMQCCTNCYVLRYAPREDRYLSPIPRPWRFIAFSEQVPDDQA